jgi:hypothetical protein
MACYRDSFTFYMVFFIFTKQPLTHMEWGLDVLTNNIFIYITAQEIACIFLLEFMTTLLAGKLWVMLLAKEEFFCPLKSTGFPTVFTHEQEILTVVHYICCFNVFFYGVLADDGYEQSQTLPQTFLLTS